VFLEELMNLSATGSWWQQALNLARQEAGMLPEKSKLAVELMFQFEGGSLAEMVVGLLEQ
jgi:hypothetical protein